MRGRLIAAFILVALLSVGLVGGYGLDQYQRRLHEHLESQYVATNRLIAQEIETMLGEMRGDLLVAASVPPIQGIIRAREAGGYDRESQTSYAEWVKRLQDIFGAMATAYQRYLQIRFLDENGNELVRVDWDGQQVRPIPLAELQNKADRPYFQETMKLAAGQVYVSPLDLNQEWGQIVIPSQPTIRLATPIFNRQGERRGLVILNVLVQTLLHQPRTLPQEQNIFVFLADQRGYYVHHSTAPEKEWGGPADLNTGYSLWADFPQAAGQILSGQAGKVYVGEWEIFYAPLRVDRQQGAPSVSSGQVFLILGRAVPVSAHRPAVIQFVGFFGILAFSLALAVGLGYFLSRRITAPLEALRQGAREIASGRFDQRVQVGGSAEIAELAGDFNRMAGQLAELYGSLQAEYQRLFESASDSIFIHDLDGRFLAVNENAARRLGYTRTELLSLSLPELDTPEAAARIEANLRRLLEQGSLVIESAHRRKDGSALPVEVSATLVDYQGQKAVMSFVRDISERKRAKEALQQALAAAQRRQAEIAALLEGSRAVLEYRDFKSAARAIFDHCKNLIGATGGYVALLSEDGTENHVLFLDPGGHPCKVDPALPMPIRGLRGEVYRTGTTTYHNDFAATEWAGLLPDGHVGLANVLFAPLVLDGKTIGLLGLANKTAGFTDNDARLASAFGALAAIALRNSRMLSSLQDSQAETGRRNAALAAQNAIAATISQSLDLDTVLNAAMDKAMAVMQAEGGGIYLLEPDGAMLTLRVYRGISEEYIRAVQHLKVGEGLSGRVVAERKPIALDVADYSLPRLSPILVQEGMQSLVSAPLIFKGTALGALNLGAKRPRAFRQEEIELLTAICQQIGVAVENARLYEQVKVQRVEEQATLLRLSQDFLAIADIQEVMARAVNTAAASLGVEFCSLLLPDDGGQRLVLRAAYGWEPERVGVLTLPLHGEETQASFTLHHRQPVVVEDVTAESRFSRPAHIREKGIVSGLSVPMLVGGAAIGVMGAHTPTRRAFTGEEVRLFALIANQTAMAIERARLFGETQRRAEQLALLNRTGLALVSDLSLERILQVVAESACQLVNADVGIISLFDHRTQTFTVNGLHCAPGYLHRCDIENITGSFRVTGGVYTDLLEGKTIRLTEISAHPKYQGFPAGHLPLRGLLGVPLFDRRRQVIGFFMVSDKLDGAAFSAEDEEWLNSLAGQASLAIENAPAYARVEERARELNREVIQQKQYAETVLRSIADGVYAVDRRRVVLSWSQGGEVIAGYTAKEAIGRSCAEFLRHRDESGQVLCETDRCPFVRVWATGKPVEPEQVFAYHKEGSLVPVSVTAAPIFDESGQAVGAVEVFRDVAKERELVESLQAASRAKTRFLANMSHELRTPLNGILGISQALVQGVYGELNAKQVARLGNIYESGQHLLRLINDLLDLARVEEDRLVLQYQPVSVAEACRGAVQMIQPIAEAKKMMLELKIEVEAAVIEADERRLRQILLNLLSNAVKFTPEGGRVGLTARERNGGVEFIVWDTGIGIAAERQPLLFQPFGQVDDDLARRYQGTGLGLALVKRLTELHGGWVAVESTPGKGSRFHVWIPARQSEGVISHARNNSDRR
jgi:PAS domain S-box-containing protein